MPTSALLAILMMVSLVSIFSLFVLLLVFFSLVEDQIEDQEWALAQLHQFNDDIH